MDQPFGGFTEEALEAYQKAVVEKEGLDFSEGDSYDFARCVRADGSFYGTRGKCRQGTEAGAKEEKTPTQKLKEGSAENPAVKRRETEKAKRAADTQRMYDRAAARRKADEEGGGYNPPSYNPNPEGAAKMARALARKKGDAAAEKAADAELKRIRKENRERPARAKAEMDKRREGAAGKPRASAGELQAIQKQLGEKAQSLRTQARAAEKAAKQVEQETKGDKSPEAVKKRLEASRDWDKATTAAERAEKAWNKAYDRWAKATKAQK